MPVLLTANRDCEYRSNAQYRDEYHRNQDSNGVCDQCVAVPATPIEPTGHHPGRAKPKIESTTCDHPAKCLACALCRHDVRHDGRRKHTKREAHQAKKERSCRGNKAPSRHSRCHCRFVDRRCVRIEINFCHGRHDDICIRLLNVTKNGLTSGHGDRSRTLEILPKRRLLRSGNSLIQLQLINGKLFEDLTDIPALQR